MFKNLCKINVTITYPPSCVFLTDILVKLLSSAVRPKFIFSRFFMQRAMSYEVSSRKFVSSYPIYVVPTQATYT